jgi:hypothetical protein
LADASTRAGRHVITTKQALAEQKRRAIAEQKARANQPIPPGLPPLHQLQMRLWGWHDTRHRSKQKYYGPQSEYSPSELAAIADAILSEIAAIEKGTDMVSKTDVFPSKYLKAADLKGQPVVLKISRAPLESLEYQGRQEDKVVLHFEGTKKMLPLNITNFDGVCDATGLSDTDEWPGQKIEVFPTTCEMKGKTIDCIRIRKPGGGVKKAAPAKVVEAEEVEMNDAIPFN